MEMAAFTTASFWQNHMKMSPKEYLMLAELTTISSSRKLSLSNGSAFTLCGSDAFYWN
jgi:hypothetical protein